MLVSIGEGWDRRPARLPDKTGGGGGLFPRMLRE